jgi:hypothetical protein
MRTSTAVIVCLAALLLLAAAPPEQEPQPEAKVATVDQVGWLVGRWTGDQDGATVTETWLPAAGGVVFGVNTVVAGEALVFFESLRIAVVDGELSYLASPEGRQPPTVFRATAIEPNHVRFANPQHDFPQWIDYQRSADTLTATIGGGDKTASWSFALTR